MEIIPVLTLDKRIDTKEQSELADRLEGIESDKTVYVLDLHGINKDKPNLCVYQRLSRDFDLWIDSGPRNLGDVVDNFLAGASAVTLRDNTWKNINIPGIREVSENKIYLDLNSKIIDGLNYYDIDGLVNFKQRNDVEKDADFSYSLKKISVKNNIFSYETDIKNLTYWKALGINKLLVDFDKLEEFERYGD